MSSLRLSVRKSMETSLGAVATLRRVADEFGQPAGSATRLDVVIPANMAGVGHAVSLSPGLWLVEATLPSGELITAQVDLAPGTDVPVVLSPAGSSPRESLGWQYLLGNIESQATLERLQQSARKAAARLAREALGKSADPMFVERVADFVAETVAYLWRWLAAPFAAALRFVSGGKFPAAAAVVAQAQAQAEIEQEVVEECILAANAHSSADADPWVALFSENVAIRQTAVANEAEIATSVYNFVAPLPTQLGGARGLPPRRFVFVSWKDQRYAISLPSPWPLPDGEGEAAAQVMVRRLPAEGGVQIGVAVLDPTFGPLAGLMTAATLSKAAVVVEQAYDMLLRKAKNPLAAAAAGYILTAAGDAENGDWREWIASLERRFPELPDSAVLRSALLLRYARNQTEIHEAREALLRAYDLGIPYFSIGVSWLVDGLTLFSGEPRIDDRLTRVQRVARRLDLSQTFTVVQLNDRKSLPQKRRSVDVVAESPPVYAANKGSSAMSEFPRDVVPTTFSTIDLQPEALANLDFTEFVNTLLEKLRIVKDERFAYYEGLRQQNSVWANSSRRWLALLGSLAFLLTAVVAALRFTDGFGDMDKKFLLAVLAIYAVMGTLNFYEKGTTKTSDYFRHLSVILGIRDLWTKLQFALVDEALALKSAGDQPDAQSKARLRIIALAEAFCNDLNKISTSELADWRSAFMASLTELSETAKKGGDDITKQLQDAVKAAEKSAADAKVAAEAAALAARPSSVNITITGDFDDEVVLSVDGVEKARSKGKSIAIESVAPGIRKFSAQARNAVKTLEASLMVEVTPGLQTLILALT